VVVHAPPRLADPEGGGLIVVRHTTPPEPMSVEEAANRLISAVLVEFEDRDDETLMPMRIVFELIGEMCGVTDAPFEDIPEWETMGWLRERCRSALTRLAEGEQIP
jgi:hypothetical protein